MISIKLEIIDEEDIEVLGSLLEFVGEYLNLLGENMVERKVRQHFDRVE